MKGLTIWAGGGRGNWGRYGLALDGTKDERCLSHAFFGALGSKTKKGRIGMYFLIRIRKNLHNGSGFPIQMVGFKKDV